MKTARPDNECPVCGEPTQTASGELTGNPHSPDCDYLNPQYIPPAELPDYFKLPGMEHKRMDLMDWRFNGIEARLGTLENNASAFRLTAIEERLSALEDWADIEYAPVDGNPPDCIHDLIAEGMTEVTSHAESRIESLSERLAIWEQWAAKQEKRIDDTLNFCQESAAALVTVATAATDKRIDAVVKQADLLQNLLASTKALLLNVDARLGELEAGRKQIDFDCEAHIDHHGVISKRLEALENRAPC